MTGREFNQDTGRAKKAAQYGPVYVTSRGQPSHVLLTFDDYQRLSGNQPNIIHVLGEPSGIEDVDFPTQSSEEMARPAEFS